MKGNHQGLKGYVMLCCYVMLCYVMLLCYVVMLCYVMLCYVKLCYVMLCCYVTLCYVMLCYVMLCYPSGYRKSPKLFHINLSLYVDFHLCAIHNLKIFSSYRRNFHGN